jgi:small-conductance mechanosensitive channel
MAVKAWLESRRHRVLALLAGLALHPLAARAQDSGLVEKSEELAGTVWGTLEGWADATLFEINQTPVTFLGIVRVIVIILVAWWLSKLLRGGLERFAKRRRVISESSLYTLTRLLHYVLLAVGFFIGLSSIGLDFTKLALLLSAIGVGLGFGLQAVFSNFVSGLIILFERSLKVGDFVELESGVTGEVREINIRSTLITTNDNVDILVPNSEFVNGRVTNWTLRDALRRIRVPFGVAYGSDKEKVRDAALEAAREVEYTLWDSPGREPKVWLVEFGDSSLNFELVVWLATREAVKRPAAVMAAYTWALESALGRHGLEIPFPQRDLHVRTVFGHKDEVLPSLGLADPAKAASETTARSAEPRPQQ